MARAASGKAIPTLLSEARPLLGLQIRETVSWAQFLESGVDALGVVDTQGHKKAAYQAFAVYARMPVDRYPLTVSSGRIRGMASADAHRASVVVWSKSPKEQSVTLDLASLPFASGICTIYRIDSQNNSYPANPTEELIPAESMPYSQAEPFSWNGTISANGVIYLEINDSSATVGNPDPEPASPGDAALIRQEHAYSSRGKTNYAWLYGFGVISWGNL